MSTPIECRIPYKSSWLDYWLGTPDEQTAGRRIHEMIPIIMDNFQRADTTAGVITSAPVPPNIGTGYAMTSASQGQIATDVFRDESNAPVTQLYALRTNSGSLGADHPIALIEAQWKWHVRNAGNNVAQELQINFGTFSSNDPTHDGVRVRFQKSGSSGSCLIDVVTGGSIAGALSTTAFTPPADDTVIKAQAFLVGNTVTVYIGGTLLVATTDTTIGTQAGKTPVLAIRMPGSPDTIKEDVYVTAWGAFIAG